MPKLPSKSMLSPAVAAIDFALSRFDEFEHWARSQGVGGSGLQMKDDMNESKNVVLMLERTAQRARAMGRN